ncbi:MAG: YbaN family protein [Caldisericia bacterium]|nr:YbaN family protein [Caldisericia bacterium]
MLRFFLVVVGWLFLGLGIIGIFVPVLPTTPFVLLSAACFLRSSSKLHLWLTNHKVFGGIIVSYIKDKSVSKQTKIIALALLWLSIGFSAVFLTSSIYVRLLLMFIAIGVSIHLALLKVKQ